jgi:hypothetical protein
MKIAEAASYENKRRKRKYQYRKRSVAKSVAKYLAAISGISESSQQKEIIAS